VNLEQDNQELDLVDYIAIVGMSTRLPGSPDLGAFWKLLSEGREAIVQFSKEELAKNGCPEELLNHPAMVSAKGFLSDADMFDAAFFGISPREAELIDPQHRVMLECAWEAMEHAGYEPSSYPGRVAIFTSAGMNTYLAFNIMTHPGLIEQVGGFQLSIYNDKDFIPTRIAYSMNTHGPAIDIGTACSSSLVGVHMACQQLLTYQADMVLVGGVTIHFPQHNAYIHEGGTAYSPDGHCRPFDATPSGLVDGNGAACIVLKRLSDAIADRDHIHAVIRGSAINNDGSDKIGYSAPSIDGQSEVILQAQAAAGVQAKDISYIEAHGTATPLGDPIEVAALTQAFRETTEGKSFCGLGSVKSNIGHVDKAAGMAGLIKTVLSLENEKLVPNLHWTAPNPKLDLPNTPFYVVNELQDWKRVEGEPRIAGISSFGVGGTNSHAILQEAPTREVGSASRQSKLIVLSARTETALETYATNLSNYFSQHPDADVADVAYTLQRGRKRFTHRLALTCSTSEDACAKLEHAAQNYVDHDASSLSFMFTGQGSQYAGMAKGLYLHEPVFQECIDQCAEFLLPMLGRDVRDFINLDPALKDQYQEDLRNTLFAQPTLFVVEYTIAKLWMHWGMRPSAMIGHSLGEYVAACIAGVFSLEDALKLVSTRSRLMQSMPAGAMMAVSLAEAEVRALLDTEKFQLDVAAINAPSLCVVSGTEVEINSLRAVLESKSLQGRLLHTSHAFHSVMMEPILAELGQLIASIKLQAPQIPYISNLTGDWITDAQAMSPGYWLDHLRHAVRFADGLSTLLAKDQHTVLVEVGPGKTLTSLAKMLPSNEGNRVSYVASLPDAQATTPAHEFITQSLGQLWVAGLSVDWEAYYAEEQRLRLALPTYPFERSKFWIEPLKPATLTSSLKDASRRKNPYDWFYTPSLTAKQLHPKQGLNAAKIVSIFDADNPISMALNKALSDAGHFVTQRMSTADMSQIELAADIDLVLFTPTQSDALTDCLKLTSLLQTLMRDQSDRSLGLCFILNQAIGQGPHSLLNPAMSAYQGIIKTIQYEYPNVSVKLIDCPASKGAPQIQQLARKLCQEVTAEQDDCCVVLRQDGRWISNLQAIELDDQEDVWVSGLIHEHGIYVIVNGLTDIGLVFAHEIAQTYPAKIILTTDSDLSSEVLDIFASRIEKIEKLGSEVHLKAVSHFTESALVSIFEEIQTQIGRINGLIDATDMHAIKPVHLIKGLDEKESARYLNNTQQHLTALQSSLEGMDLEFCLIMSSLTAQIGGTGQLVSSAAAAYLQSFAHNVNQGNQTPWIVAQWDAWKATEETISTTTRTQDFALSPNEGAQAFRLMMRQTLAPCLVIATNPPETRSTLKLHKQDPLKTQDKIVGERRYERPNLSNQFIAPRNEHEQAIAELWQKSLGINRIGVEDNFFDLGGHSLLGAQLTVEMQQKFKVPVDIGLLFAYPTIATISGVLLEQQVNQSDEELLAQQLDQLEQMTDEEVQALLERTDLPQALAKALGLA
jgi:acyl transferase domain-containing protein